MDFAMVAITITTSRLTPRNTMPMPPFSTFVPSCTARLGMTDTRYTLEPSMRQLLA